MIGRLARLVLLLAALASPSAAQQPSPSRAHGPLRADEPVRGWTILSDSEVDDLAVIAAAPSYRINHLQLSHEIVMDLSEVRDEKKRALVNRLTDAAHAAGHPRGRALGPRAVRALVLSRASSAPAPNGTIDLDNPAFWAWLKDDYRDMLDRVPEVDGIVLTFIETGARAERQHSREAEDAAGEAGRGGQRGGRRGDRRAQAQPLRAYVLVHARGVRNDHRRDQAVQAPDVRLMMKETPHDFFLTHPNDRYAGTIARPTLIEFDAAGEFNGQGLIAITWPEYMLGRCARPLASVRT